VTYLKRVKPIPVVILFGLHVMSIFFGLVGLLVMVPHPELYSGIPLLATLFPSAMQHGAEMQMILGAATMFAFGVYAIGWWKTCVFFAIGTILPLGAELMGTGTGWPFGGYGYEGLLGAKLGGRVPYSVPLSWFYMGFASYLLAIAIVGATKMRGRSILTLLLGGWLLVAWDLVLDPAMASPNMHIHFWDWHVNGVYFGMPLRNLLGWFGTGLVFMTLSRLLWFTDADARRIPAWLPFGMYLANTVWAMSLSLSVGLWQTAVAAIVFGLLPASLVWRHRSNGAGGEQQTGFAVESPLSQARVPGPSLGR